MAPLASARRGIAEVFSQPRALFGGLALTAIFCAGVVAALGASSAQAQSPEAEVPFEAGVLTPLGVVHPDDVVVLTVETHTVAPEPEVEPEPEPEPEPETSPEQVTTEPETSPEPKPVKPKPVKPKPVKPSPPKDTGEAANQNSQANNPYPEPPTVEQNAGDPFGDVHGWGDLVKDGDAWATEVMRRLNAMRVPAWAAQVPNGRYSFRLRVCSDGRIDKVFTSKSSGDARLDATVKTEVMRTKLPPMPAKLQKHMSGRCSTLKYTFAWGGGRVR